MGLSLSIFNQLAEVVNNPEIKSQLTSCKVYCLLLQRNGDYGFNDVQTDARLRDGIMVFDIAENEAAIKYFRSLLDIKYRRCSVIVISTDLNSSDVVLLDSDASSVVSQLDGLADYVSGCNADLSDGSFVDFISGLGSFSVNSLDQSFAETVYEVAAANAVAESDDCYSNYKDLARGAVRSTIDKFFSSIPICGDDNMDEWGMATQRYYDYKNLCRKRRPRVLRCISKDESMPRFTDSFIGVESEQPLSMGFMQMPMPTPRRAKRKPGDQYKIDIIRLSELMNKAHLNIIRMYNGTIDYIYNLSEKDMELFGSVERDFGLASVALCNIFTIEFNESVVQLMRKALGIPMPEFYMKYMPGVKCFAETGRDGERINLNHLMENEWSAPTVGQTLYALKCLLEKESVSDVFKAYPFLWDQKFINSAIFMCNVRNAGGHACIVSEERFAKQFEAFSYIFYEHLSDMLEMKVDLRS